MARGDECKTASKANHACKNFDVTGPLKQSIASPAPKKAEEKKEKKENYGSYGQMFKNKKHFTDMHFC